MTLPQTHDSLGIEALGNPLVAILGDIIVDHYVHGTVDRVSPEAPISILHAAHERFTLGGAANVAANVSALGGRAILHGAIGCDSYASLLSELFAAHPTVALRLLPDAGRPTTVKTRYLGGQHQLLRVDRENCAPLNAEYEGKILAAMAETIDQADILAISDYGKGVVSDGLLHGALSLAAAARKPVIIDPKRTDFTDYRGATIITPNRKELAQATGHPCDTDDNIERAGRIAADSSGAAILLTRSERGMSLFRPGRPTLHSPADALEVYDVSGAGDTVVAAFSLAIASGFDEISAMQIANAAAGVVVAKHGTATATKEEVRATLKRKTNGDVANSTVVGRTEAVWACTRWKQRGLSVGFANGCFDLLHPGHLKLLNAAAAACDRLVVAINADDSVRRLKGADRPIQNQEARAAVLAGLRGVALVTIFEEDTPLELIKAIKPDIVVKGADYARHEVVGHDVVESYGGHVILVELDQRHSTTAITRRIADRLG